MDKKGKIEDLIDITYSPVEGGVELFVKSERIHAFVHGQSKTLATDAAGAAPTIKAGSALGSPSWLKDKKFYKLPKMTGATAIVSDIVDFTQANQANYSSILLASTELGEGLTLKINGMVAKSALDAAATHLKTTATALYKSFVAPYKVTIKVSTNEEA